ncbi:MAG: GDSL-type esterase/lipase family protein [Eubacteriales bacterium]|nr:GDSL-type esterase/lipase family protein [Eubacteriales bacterium]
MAKELNNDGKEKIQINRRMRMWNKYRNYIIGAAVVLVIAILCAILVNSCGKDKTKSDGKNQNKPTVTEEMTTSADITTAQESTTSVPTTAAVQPTTQAPAGGSVKVSGEASETDFTSGSAYEGAVFLGDAVIGGISGYGYLGSDKVVSNNNMTTDKGLDYVSEVKGKNPSKIYIMLGLNDLNYGTRSGSDIAGRIETLVKSIKNEIPGAKVCVLSVLPISSSFESKSSVKITQSGIDELNNSLSEKASSMGVTYVDIASCFKDGSGYLGSSYTTGGYDIKNGYYPFMLNSIAEVTK